MQQLSNSIRRMWEEKPLSLAIILAIIVRLLAVIFARGFGMHDDHFLVVEVPHSWAVGRDYNSWLPWSEGNQGPSGHSLFYPGLQYLFFWFFEKLNISSPQIQMFFNRLLHAAFSLITIIAGYRITKKISGKKAAALLALLLAVLWFQPWFSVRNLVEIVCIPFLSLALWWIIASEEKRRPWLWALAAGLMLGFAFAIRYQTLIIAGGLGLALLLQKKWKATWLLAAGCAVGILITQGLIDFLIWGKPFAEFIEYFNYNFTHAHAYIEGDWYNYLLLLLGILIPPISIFLFLGYFKNWKKYLILFLPSFLFLLLHSLFPNKQERFIIPMLPFLLIGGIAGWQELKSAPFWSKHRKFINGSWVFFWILNTLLLIFVSTMYSKKARVESMSYLSRYDNIEFIVQEDLYRSDTKLPPEYYYGEPVNVYDLCNTHGHEALSMQLKEYGPDKAPRFVLFFGEKNLDQRIEDVHKIIPGLVYETTIDPGLVDKVLFWLNPLNANETITIYRNTRFFPEKAESRWFH